jgi:hypothetical protein
MKQEARNLLHPKEEMFSFFIENVEGILLIKKQMKLINTHDFAIICLIISVKHMLPFGHFTRSVRWH